MSQSFLFYNFFRTLVEKKASVTVELKNDLSVQGTITHVDQFLNIKLDDIRVSDAQKHPHLQSVQNLFIRGSVVRYVHLNRNDVQERQIQEAAIREALTRRKETLAVMEQHKKAVNL